MDDLGICFAEAYQLSNHSPASNSVQMNWQEIAIQYEAYRIKTGLKQKTFNSEERYRIDRAMLLINAAKNATHDGKELLKAYDHHYLSDLAPGSPGRKRNLLDVCRFLGFSVRSCGAPTKWLPPSAEEVSVLVGVREISPAPAVPVKPEQLLFLLESLTENPELRLAVGLVGLYGLRPAELMALTVKEERLYVAPVKRNRATAKQPKKDRLVLPLDLKELPGEGQRVLQLYASGLVKLPVGIRNASDFKACGAAFRQYLDRQPCWKSLVAATPHLIPYSLRHGYAWRGVKYYESSMPMRDLAALMGHDLRTHHKHYGVLTDEAGLHETALRVVGDLMKLQS